MSSMGFCLRLDILNFKKRGIIRNIQLVLNNTYMKEKDISNVNIVFEENNARKRKLKLLPFAMTG